jgi:hypothetical protein
VLDDRDGQLERSTQKEPTSVLRKAKSTDDPTRAAEDVGPVATMNWLRPMRNVVAQGRTSSLPSKTA